MKIGILGGSFNPIHCGHLIIARKAYQLLNPSKFFFVPSYQNPLKTNKKILSYNERVYLIEKALKDYPEFEISLLDNNDKVPSYSYFLVKKFKKIYPSADIYFIVGKDILTEFDKWYNYQWLLKNIKFVIINRKINIKNLPDYAKDFIFLNIKPIEISSTMIREKIKKGEPIKNLVPPSIEADIIKLYSSFFNLNK